MLEFNIRNQEISRIDNFSPAEKSVGYLEAKFNFKTDDWNEAIKRAIFRNVKSKVEKDTMLEDDSCIVPWEVLVGSSDIEVSVHGVIDTENITTNVAVFNLDRTLSGGSASQEPSPTVYEQMLKEMQETKNIAQSVRDDADAGKFGGGTSITVDTELSEESEKPVQNKVIAKEVIALKEHNTQLKETIEKLQIKVTTEKATFHHITDSANMKVVDFGMEGKTEQKTTSGKNLFDYKSDKWSTSIGDMQQTYASISLVDEGIQLINNVTGSNTWIEVYYEVDVEPNTAYQIKAKHNRNYPLSVCDSSGSTIGSDITCDGKSIRSFTSPSDGKIYIKFSTTRGSAEPNDSTYTEIMLSTDASVYEPFTGRMPSPNPDFKQEIVNAGVYNEETGRYEIGCSVGNVNLLDYKEVVNNFRNKNYVKLSSGYNVTSLQFEPNTEYYIKVNGIRCTWATFLISTQQNVNGSVAKAVGVSNTWNSENCVTTDETGLIYFGISNPIDNVIEQIEQSLREALVQIEIGSSATEYEEHTSQKLTLTSPVPITKWDKLVKRDDVWGWSIYKLPLIIGGTGNWIYHPGLGCFYLECLPEVMVNHEGFCNQLRVALPSEKNSLYIGNTNKCILVYNTSFHDDTLEDGGLANWKAHLNENPLEIITYSDTEQSFHPLPDEEQELLNNLETYYGVTNLYNDQGCPTWLTYIADPKLYLDNQLLEIKSAIV